MGSDEEDDTDRVAYTFYRGGNPLDTMSNNGRGNPTKRTGMVK